MPECVGSYFIPSANGSVEGVDMLAGARIWNFLNIYVNRPPIMLLVILLIFGLGAEFPQLYINYCYPNCQFVALTYTGQCYLYHVLSCPEIDQLQNCLDNVFALLENWCKANKHANLNRMCHIQ